MTVFDGTDKFDTRLERLNSTAPPAEGAAAINVYERLRTAQAIVQSLLKKPDDGAALAVLQALCMESNTLAVAEGNRLRSISERDGADA